MPAPRWSFDTSRWPVVVLALPTRPSEPPDMDALFRDADALFARGERFILVHDLRHANPDATRRMRLVEWARRNRDVRRRVLAAYALVAPSALQRGLIVAIRWFEAPVVPLEVFADLQSALDWAERRARAEGLKGR